MRRLPKLNISKPKVLTRQYSNWRYGENRLVTADSIRQDELSETKNIVLVEDGLPRGPRWGYAQYGVDATGNKICLLDRYVDSGGDIHLLIVSGGKLRSSTDNGATWDEISGVTFTTDQDVAGVQAYGLYRIVAEDTSYCVFDGSTVTTYSAITSPTGVAAAETGIGAGTHTYYYRVVAVNNLGQTLPSSEVSESVALKVSDWADDGSDYVTITWSAVTGATGYEIYRSTISGNGELLDYVESQAVVSYKDYGGVIGVTNPLVGLPEANTTSGPTGTDIALYKDSLIICGSDSRLYYSGGGDVIGHFNRKDGGGWIDVNKDSDDGELIKAHKFQDSLLIFKERSIWQFDFTADTSIGVRVKNVTTAVGGVARKTIVTVENDVYFLSDRGVFTVGNEPNYLNQIRTNELSARVRSRITAKNQALESNACAGYFDSKYWLFFASGSDLTNNNAVMYDRERLGWTYHDSMPFAQAKMFYDDTDTYYLLGGDTDADVFDFGSDYDDDDGTIIDWIMGLRAEDFEKETIYKTAKDFHIKLSGVSGQIEVKVVNDGAETVKETAITVVGNDAGLNVDLLNIDPLNVGAESSSDVTTATIIRRSLRLKRNIWLNQQLILSNVAGTKAICTLRAVYQSAKAKSPRKNKSGEKI